MAIHPEAQRVFERMKPHCPHSIAEDAAFGYPLPSAPSPEEWMGWARHLCDALERRLPEDVIKNTRMACRCSLKWGNIHAARKIYDESASLEEFAAKARQLLGTVWEAWEGSLFVTYAACSCPMVNESSALLSRTWCYCTLGYNRDYFAEVFGANVSVELLQAIKLGDAACVMKITLEDTP